jgi:hypothetical protein
VLQGDRITAVLRGRLDQGAVKEHEGVVWQRMKYDSLTWGQLSAQALLQGKLAQAMLSPRYILLNGKHRPPYDPKPGIDQVEVAEIISNPNDLGAAELFVMLSTH